MPAAAGQTLVENVLIVPPVFPGILFRARSHPVPAASTVLTELVSEGSSIHGVRRPYRIKPPGWGLLLAERDYFLARFFFCFECSLGIRKWLEYT